LSSSSSSPGSPCSTATNAATSSCHFILRRALGCLIRTYRPHAQHAPTRTTPQAFNRSPTLSDARQARHSRHGHVPPRRARTRWSSTPHEVAYFPPSRDLPSPEMLQLPSSSSPPWPPSWPHGREHRCMPHLRTNKATFFLGNTHRAPSPPATHA
jgi:hypothetical protein